MAQFGSRPLFISLILLAVLPAAVAAQPTASASSVLASPPRSSIALEFVDASGPWTQPVGDVARNRTRGAVWGGGIGLLAGGLLGGLTVQSDDEGDGFGGSPLEGAATGEAVILGAVVGAGIGALLGATVFAPARRDALLVQPTRSGLVLGARVGLGR
jgi:hypothetical protein